MKQGGLRLANFSDLFDKIAISNADHPEFSEHIKTSLLLFFWRLNTLKQTLASRKGTI